MHVLGTGVPRHLGVARSASSPKAAQTLGCSLPPGLQISFGRVTCMARAASVPGLWTLGFLLLCGACVSVWVVLGFGFRLRPDTPGWGVGACVCLCACSACTPPLLAGVCGVGVCAWGRVSAAPRHSWLGCAVWVCVFGLEIRLHPATLGWGRGVCVSGVRAPLVPRHSCLGCAVWVCVFGLGFRLRPATPGWGVGVCVFVCVLPLYPATVGQGVRRGCVCLGSGFICAPSLLAGVLWCVFARVRAPLVPRHSWLGCAVWVCVFGLGFQLRPATPGWGVGVCVFVCVLP